MENKHKGSIYSQNVCKAKAWYDIYGEKSNKHKRKKSRKTLMKFLKHDGNAFFFIQVTVKKRRPCLIFQEWIYDFTPLLPLCWAPISYYAYHFASESTAFISILGIGHTQKTLIPNLTKHQLRTHQGSDTYICHEYFYKKLCE